MTDEMKRIEELGISPTPWSAEKSKVGFEVGDEEGFNLSYEDRYKHSDACLIAAAPKLYEALREAVKSYCEGCNDFVNGDQRCDPCECLARKWRAVLAEAAGESEVANV